MCGDGPVPSRVCAQMGGWLPFSTSAALAVITTTRHVACANMRGNHRPQHPVRVSRPGGTKQACPVSNTSVRVAHLPQVGEGGPDAGEVRAHVVLHAVLREHPLNAAADARVAVLRHRGEEVVPAAPHKG